MTTELSVLDAIKLSGYTRIHIYNLILEKRVVASKNPRKRWRIDKASLLEYLKFQEREPVADDAQVSV